MSYIYHGFIVVPLSKTLHLYSFLPTLSLRHCWSLSRISNTWISIVLLFSNLWRINTVQAMSHCLPDQKAILLQIRSNLTYDSSAAVKLARWDEGVDCCKWAGVSCNAERYICGLDLSYERITGGSLAPVVFLQSLALLDLSGNKFSGGQMTDLQNVTSPLIRLDLSSNNLEGPIPPFIFRLRNLSSLYLSSNRFNGTVHLSEFINLENMVNLDLSHNRLVVETSMSAGEHSVLPQFGGLWLASCNIQKFPSFLEHQDHLMMLDLSNDAIKGQPGALWRPRIARVRGRVPP